MLASRLGLLFGTSGSILKVSSFLADLVLAAALVVVGFLFFKLVSAGGGCGEAVCDVRLVEVTSVSSDSFFGLTCGCSFLSEITGDMVLFRLFNLAELSDNIVLSLADTDELLCSVVLLLLLLACL